MSRMITQGNGEFLDTLTGEILSSERAHIRDMEIIREELLAESDRREWCREYESFVNRVNDMLCYKLSEREAQWEMVQTFTVTVRVPIKVAMSEEVTSMSEYTDNEIGRYPSVLELRKLMREFGAEVYRNDLNTSRVDAY